MWAIVSKRARGDLGGIVTSRLVVRDVGEGIISNEKMKGGHEHLRKDRERKTGEYWYYNGTVSQSDYKDKVLMEIDLNSPNGYSNGSFNGNEDMGGAALNKTSICLELWHACAGPLISLPRKGSLVVYFPQGHMEQVTTSLKHQCLEQRQMRPYDLPPQIFCRVLNVNLHADQETDEVYAQVTLVPEPEPAEKDLEEEEEDEEAGVLNKSTPHMFCKTLTASDTSTHGGFSVPRRAAEDCFPPLDYNQQRPSQELVAKDLHGVEWRFRHIYRGQPRRHLLTTGWSVFVNHKGLMSGDAVLFLRGENGELRLGIRRAARQQSVIPSSVLSSQSMHLGVLASAANAVATKSMFHIFYNPRYINMIRHCLLSFWKVGKL
eukprot:Gb_17830 [translate_table: standard]